MDERESSQAPGADEDQTEVEAHVFRPTDAEDESNRDEEPDVEGHVMTTMTTMTTTPETTT